MGESSGHPFRGNQWAAGIVGGATGSTEGTRSRGDFIVDPRGIAQSFREAAVATNARKQHVLAESRRVLRIGETFVKSGRKKNPYTLTVIEGDRFWIPVKGNVIADSLALEEFGTPYLELLKARGGNVDG